MENLNWVEERRKCSVHAMFERLRLEVKDDVGTRQEVREKDSEFGYANGFFFNSTSKSFSASRQESDGLRRTVIFSVEGDRIVASDENDKEIVGATVTLDDEMECVFVVHGELVKDWQFRKAALESLFFG